MKEQRPNFLIILTDEERYPPSYETDEVKEFRRTQLKGRQKIKKHGVEFHSHYTAATACTPSRASLLTGHYPSLHGAVRTGANGERDAEFSSWVHPQNLPTLGHYFQSIGYQTHYRGKWHLSDEDIRDDKQHRVKSSFMGAPLPEGEALYLQDNKLEKFGFSDSPWIGPEPHGIDDSNFGIYRDPLFANQTIDLLHSLDSQFSNSPKNNKSNDQPNHDRPQPDGMKVFSDIESRGGEEEEEEPKPFVIFCSLLNPHDILALPGYFRYYLKHPAWDDTVPHIPDPPNADDPFINKPIGLKEGLSRVKEAWLPTPHPSYRRFYYYLHKVVDYEIERIYDALHATSLFDNTYVIFTSDHGDLLSSHGYSIQKWYNAYDETIKIPFVISHPLLFPSSADEEYDEEKQNVYNHPTSAVDLIPTLLALAGQSHFDQIYEKLKEYRHPLYQPDGFRVVPPLIGNNLSSLFLSRSRYPQLYQNIDHHLHLDHDAKYRAIYFMTEDDFLKFPNYDTPLAYLMPAVKLFSKSKVNRVQGGCQIEAVVVYLPQTNKLWKFVRFWENSKYWTQPFICDEIYVVNGPDKGKKIVVTDPAPDQYEMYDLNSDPIEMNNLYFDPNYADIRVQLVEVLLEMKAKVRLAAEDHDKLILNHIPYGKFLGKPDLKLPLSYQLATFAIVGAISYLIK